jgi:TolB-like protein/Tfp pilus assembly protein PilF
MTSLAVLPLENRSSGAVPDFFAEGMTDELISQLQRISALRVRSRTSVSAYKAAGSAFPRSPANSALTPSSRVRSIAWDDRVRITVRLIGARDRHAALGRHLRARPAGRADAAARGRDRGGDARRCGADTRRARAPRGRARSRPRCSISSFAGATWGAPQQDDLVAATAALERAVQLDPQFARAHGALALAYVLRAFNFEPDREAELTAAAEAAAARALAIDPGVADAHVARGRLIWTRRNGFPHLEAAREFRRAIELNPGSATALGDLALVYNHIGLLDLALAAAGDALAIDPSESRALLQMGFALLSQGRAAEALGVLRRLPPGFHPRSSRLMKPGRSSRSGGAMRRRRGWIARSRSSRQTRAGSWRPSRPSSLRAMARTARRRRSSRRRGRRTGTVTSTTPRTSSRGPTRGWGRPRWPSSG